LLFSSEAAERLIHAVSRIDTKKTKRKIRRNETRRRREEVRWGDSEIGKWGSRER